MRSRKPFQIMLARLPRLRRLARDERGATSIEFAMIALPFFGLLFAIIEVCMVFFAGQILEKATQDASRKILTGQAQVANFSAAQFKQQVCNQLLIIFNCSDVFIDVKSYPAFSSVNITPPVDGSGNFVNNFTYSPGDQNDIVVVRVMYQWPLYVPTLGFNLSDIGGNKKLLMATATFRNEPY
jgi:Flp pilus assembly protein TadG